MHIKKLTFWFLLAFVALFWNLGPSLHHVEIFGFHAADLGLVSHCSCCSHSHPSDTDDQPYGVISQDGHCWLCDFFDQLHLVIEVQCDSPSVQLVAFAELPVDSFADSQSVSPHARGPPRA